MIDYNRIMRLVAKQKGYKFIDLNDNPHGAIVKGQPIAVMNAAGETIGYGWDFDDALKVLPQWLEDEGAAMSLLKFHTWWTIERNGTTDFVCKFHSETHPVESAHMTTLSFAVVDAFLNVFEINESWDKQP